MRISNKSGRPLFKSAIEACAKVDAMLNLMDEQDTELFWDWAMHEGSDVSRVVRSLVVASLSDNITTEFRHRDSTKKAST